MGHATAAQYTAALLDWAPRLRALKPDLLLGANGPMGCRSCSEHPEDKGVCWWEQARARRGTLGVHVCARISVRTLLTLRVQPRCARSVRALVSMRPPSQDLEQAGAASLCNG